MNQMQKDIQAKLLGRKSMLAGHSEKSEKGEPKMEAPDCDECVNGKMPDGSKCKKCKKGK